MLNDSDQIESKRQLTTYASLCTEYYDLDKPNPPEDALAFHPNVGAETRSFRAERKRLS